MPCGGCENDRTGARQCECVCGTGILLAIIFFLAHLPLILLVLPVAALFLGLVADPDETHAVWYGMLSTIGIFDISALNQLEKANYTEKRHYFWFGEVAMASILAGSVAVPLGFWLAEMADSILAFTGATLLFLVLFIFLPKIVRHVMREDANAAIEAFGKNEHVRKVFWAVFVAMAGTVVAQVLDPATAHQVVNILMGLAI